MLLQTDLKAQGAGRFWFVPVPLPTKDAKLTSEEYDELRWQHFSTIRPRLFEAVGNNSEQYPIDLPAFKIGTLDSLMAASSELERVDPQTSSILNKLLANYRMLLVDTPSPDTFEVAGKRPELYLNGFTWNSAKYGSERKIGELVEEIGGEVTQIDTLVKAKLADYQQAKNALQTLEGKCKGSLQTRSIRSILSELKEYQPVESEYLQTVFIVTNVPDRFTKEYQELAPMIVADSMRVLAKEQESSMFALTLFRKHLAEFKENCSKNRYTVRELEPEMNDHKTEELESNVKSLWANVVRLLKTNISEVFGCCAHLKVVRCFTEAVLQYGLPPEYLFFVVNFKSTSGHGTERRLIRTLNALISGSGMGEWEGEGEGDEQDKELWTVLDSSGHIDTCPVVRVCFEWHY